MKKWFLLSLIFYLVFTEIEAQTIVSGKVIDASTGAPIPFANVVFTGTTEGAIADFDGNFIAKTSLKVDSIEFRYVGFITSIRPIKEGVSQVVEVALEEDILQLQEVIVTPGENPAWEVMRKVIKSKKVNDKRRLKAYEYESYTRTAFDIDNFPLSILEQKKKGEKKAAPLDTTKSKLGILPVFMSESISEVFYQRNPSAKHERIIKTNISGVGITDGTLTSQIIGSSFQEYNFYQNWLNITEKEFMSPIADGWKLMYEYELEDSVYIDDHFCYRLTFAPKQSQDLAFYGTMWITKEEYAVKQIEATVDGAANVNFIDKINIQQELTKTTADSWLPTKNRVVIDITPLSQDDIGYIARFYVSNKNFVVNQKKDKRFFMNPISMDKNVRSSTDAYWQEVRHDSLTIRDLQAFTTIDSLNELPIIKRTVNLTKFLATGYLKTGPFDLGPYTTFYGNNNIEGIRLGIGARTNIDFSNKWVFGGYLGYGIKDNDFKYNIYAYTILNRNRWTVLRLEHQRELDQVWLLNENIRANSLFYSLSRFGTLTQPFIRKRYRMSFSRQLGTGLNAEISAKQESFTPQFDFAYFSDETRAVTDTSYQTSELMLSLRYGRDEIVLINDNERMNLGAIRKPVYRLDYTYGSSAIGGDFSYHKLRGSIQKKQKLGLFGVSNFQLAGGYIFGTVPYTLAFNPIGNESLFFTNFAYNQMNFFEFSSDRFVEFRYRHSFEGMIFNRIPLFRKLKWRSLASASVLYGDLKDENANVTVFGDAPPPFRIWENEPYIEVGYGIENIFKVLSVQAFHRLTYLDENVNSFGLKGSITLRF